MTTKCSVKSLSRNKQETCMTKENILDFLGKAFSEDFNQESLKKLSRKPKNELLKILREKTGTGPDEEHKLWGFINNSSYDLFFRMFYILYKPKAKKTTKVWLNNIDIDRMVYQSIKEEKLWKNFLGTFSCDTFMTDQKFKMKPGTGMILNTSKMSQKGQHWVAIYLDSHKTLYYFDPLGDLPNKCLYSFIKKKINPLKININNIEFQKKDGTCGDFCITFMINMINRGNYDYISYTPEEKINNIVRKSKMY